MFIAFEGPDNVGKSTSARELDCAEQPDYQATKKMHESNVAARAHNTGSELLMPHTYDRIDWFSHMIYRLALPDRDWNDDRPRTVFAMPDTHLVIKLHHPELSDFVADEVVDTPIKYVNPMYYHFGIHFMALNERSDYSLFKSISMIEVRNTPEGYEQRMMAHDNPAWSHSHDALLPRMVDSNDSLLRFLQDVEVNIG